jgi:hypothetical protein
MLLPVGLSTSQALYQLLVLGMGQTLEKGEALGLPVQAPHHTMTLHPTVLVEEADMAVLEARAVHTGTSVLVELEGAHTGLLASHRALGLAAVLGAISITVAAACAVLDTLFLEEPEAAGSVSTPALSMWDLAASSMQAEQRAAQATQTGIRMVEEEAAEAASGSTPRPSQAEDCFRPTAGCQSPCQEEAQAAA